jgi:hypothetical protein
MRRSIACGLVALMLAPSFVSVPVFAQSHRQGPPEPYQYWENRRAPPSGHEFHQPPAPSTRWDDRRNPPPNWGRSQWQTRQEWLRRHGDHADNYDSALGIIAGTLLGFAIGSAVVDSQEQQQYATSRLNDPGWVAYCARRYRTFDPYTGTYLGSDGLRHYCR